MAQAVSRAAWARVRWPSGESLASNQDTRLDEPVLAGSIFKVIAARAALEQGGDLAALRVVCPRRLTVAGRRVDCVHPDLGRPLSLEDALAHSCNAYFARLAERLDREQLVRTLRGLTGRDAPAVPDAPWAPVVLGLAGPVLPMRVWLRATLKALEPDSTVAIDVLRPLRRGLARAAREGSAAALGDTSAITYAKTGTVVSSPVAPAQEGHLVAWRPEIGEAVVVRVAGGAGRDAAQVAAAVWDQAARAAQPGIRIGRLRTGTTDVTTVPLEDYVAGVVAAEGEATMPEATLQALAMLARSYASRPDGRHARDGFDVCDTTHCQVFGPPARWSRAATQATTGLVLWRDGAVVAAPYSASCSGTLASGDPEPAPHAVSTWSSEVTADAVRNALATAGHRGDVLRDLVVRTRAQGRPLVIGLDGLMPDVVDADRFRRTLGQQIGWHVLKSDEWTVVRTARGYRFDGRGKGHGRGVCVAGASVLGAAGTSPARMLSTYLPGTTIASLHDTVRLTLPGALTPRRAALDARFRRTLADLRLQLGMWAPRTWDVRVHPTVAAYQRATGRAWWTSASTRRLAGDVHRVDIAPPPEATGEDQLVETWRHEVVHGLTMAVLSDAPLWVQEGLAVHATRPTTAPASEEGACPADDDLGRPGSQAAMRDAYARAAACVAARLPAGRDLSGWRQLAP